jgi:CPA2 family monovalent cation:H+ antiporter-2
MVLSESEFSHQALSDVIPLRDVFGLLFFASAGMLLDPAFLVEHLGQVIAAVALVVAGKAVILGCVTRIFGYGNMAPLIVALGMSQVGEFSFVLAREGLRLGYMSRDLYALSLTTALASMAMTPFLQKAAGPAYRLWRRLVPQERPLGTVPPIAHDLDRHVVVVGYGRTGRAAVEVMARIGVPFVVIESDHARFGDCARKGPALWGDAVGEPILHAARLDRARLLLVTVPDIVGIRQVVGQARSMRADVRIIARAQSPENLEELRRLGVDDVVQPEFEAGLEMVRLVLVRYRFPAREILRWSDAVHREVYEPFADRRSESEELQSLEDLRRAARSLEIEWIAVPPDSPLVGSTIAASEFRKMTGTSIVAVRDREGLHPNPRPDHVLREGDLLGVLGTPEERRTARDLLERVRPDPRPS